jgi:recombination associated protein RdgC
LDFVDLIEEKRFLGQEFLTWLWWKSEERGGSVALPGYGDISLVFEKHMLLEFGEGESAEKLICSGLKAELQEARTGLQVGKKLEHARIRMTKGDNEYSFTLVATLMEFRNIRLPKTAMTETEESGNREDMEGMILERIYLFEELHQTVNALFRSFLDVRLDQDWSPELAKIRVWIATTPLPNPS